MAMVKSSTDLAVALTLWLCWKCHWQFADGGGNLAGACPACDEASASWPDILVYLQRAVVQLSNHAPQVIGHVVKALPSTSSLSARNRNRQVVSRFCLPRRHFFKIASCLACFTQNPTSFTGKQRLVFFCGHITV
jgi:hypothetical protein